MPSHSAENTASVPRADGSATKASPCRTEVLIRLWVHADEDKKLQTDETNAKRQGAIAFIEDVVASRNGVVGTTEDGLFLSVLKSPADALVVSRQILVGMRGFQEKSGAPAISVSISLDANRQKSAPLEEPIVEGTPGNSEGKPKATLQASHELSSLIHLSRPAQVLLTHDLFQQVSVFKGLPLKPFHDRFGVFEYQWTTEEKLVEFQNQQGGFIDLVEGRKTESVPPPPESTPSLSYPIETHFEPRAKTPFTSEDEQSPAWKRPWVIAVVTALVLVVIAVAVIAFRTQKPATVAQNITVDLASSSDPAKVTRPETHAGAIQAAQAPSTPKRALAKERTAAPQQKPEKKKIEATTDVEAKAAATPTQPKTECSLSGDLQRYVRVAEGYRGQGHYSDATRLFSEILNCDPNNQDARKGLERTKAAEAVSGK
jgi:hypothetical protein